MEKPTNLEQLSKSLLNKFLIHFVPGIILFFAFLRLIDFRLDSGLLSFVIICSFSWTLGMLLEIIFFKKNYQLRNDGELISKPSIHYLLLSKVGLAILLAIGVNVFISVLEILNFRQEQHPRLVLILAVKTLVFGGFGLFLFLFFKKSPQD